MNYGFTKSKKIILTLVSLSLLLSFSPIFATKAKAQWVVWDPTNFVPISATAINTGVTAASYTTKEYGLDSVVWAISNMIIKKMTADTVNWINSGFRQSPAFITSPEAYFQGLGDKIAGQFIMRNPNLSFLCGPISAKIRIALSNTYNRDNIRWQCTLTQVGRNMEDFMNDFDNGGWDSFFQISQDQHMNPIGAYIQAEGELFQQIANKTDEKNKELSWGKGFLSFKTCKTWSNPLPADQIAMDQDILPDDIESNGNRVCLEPEISTPGTVIETSLNNALNLGNQKLVVANEFNEIVSALLNQLVTQVVGGGLRGLRGLSRPDSASNNTVFTNQLSSTTNPLTDYFGNPQNNSTVNTLLNSIQTPDGATPSNPVYPPGTQCNPLIDQSCSTTTP
jgi:hypothetical protein